MEQNDLIDLLVEKSVEYLIEDDANPDVGMGMFIDTAIDYAWKDICIEAARWNSMEALRLELTTEIRHKATDMVIKIRRKHRYT